MQQWFIVDIDKHLASSKTGISTVQGRNPHQAPIG